MRLTRHLDPRLHLAAAIGWLVFAIVALAALAAATLAAQEAEQRAIGDAKRLLAQFATQIRQTLDTTLATRRAIVLATATQIGASGEESGAALRRHLRAVQVQFPEFAWLGVADSGGRVLADTGALNDGESVAARHWFRAGLRQPILDDVHAALAPAPVPGGPARFVEIAAPVTAPAGPVLGVVGARLSWAWLDAQIADVLHTLDTRRQLDLLLVAGDGRVLVGPPGWAGRSVAPTSDLGDAGARLVGRSSEPADRGATLGWTVVVRQDRASALASARRVRGAVFGVVLLAGLTAAAAAVGVTWLLTRRLARLSDDAQAVRTGRLRAPAVPAGSDEVARIGATLAGTIEHLQQEKQALATLNAELDARVTERTARIERLAEESRHAAVTRERLRLARELHDTLAHSLMALLTQIRLVRKLRARLDAEALDAELERAEGVAATGLAEARAAITQMRHNGVRDAGLGAALHELLARFRERSGLAAELQADAAVAVLADARAETVFRIVEEALHNVERHAQAHAVQVTLGRDGEGGRVQLEVVDDGVGFDPAQPRPGHFGLDGMREQASLIGARFTLDSRVGGGTRLRLAFDA